MIRCRILGHHWQAIPLRDKEFPICAHCRAVNWPDDGPPIFTGPPVSEKNQCHDSWPKVIGRAVWSAIISALVVGSVITHVTSRHTQQTIAHVLNYAILALLFIGLIGGFIMFKPWRRK